MSAHRSRRGSTLVLVAFMLVVFMAMGAIAADVGRFYLVTAELQTAADAAALAGALVVQKSTDPTTVASDVDSVVKAFVRAANHADGDSLTITSDSIRLALFTPRRPPPDTLTYQLAGARPNALTVSISLAPRGLFAQAIGKVGGLNLSRSATAWVAHLSEDCVRPFAFPYVALYQRATGIAAASPAASFDTILTTGTQFRKYIDNKQTPAKLREFIFLAPGASTALPTDGHWEGFNFTGSASPVDFTDAIKGCRPRNITVGTADGIVPAMSSSQFIASTSATIGPGATDAVNCYRKGAAAADCFSSISAPTPGVDIKTGWSDDVISPSTAVHWRLVGYFILTCYVEALNDACSQEPGKSYPAGTILGVFKSRISRDLKKDDILGNAPSNVQRIVLVR